MIRSLLLLTFCSSLLLTSTDAATPYGIQGSAESTTSPLSTYGGAIHYDSANHWLYVTGSTYGSFGDADNGPDSAGDCILGILQLPRDPNDPLYKATDPQQAEWRSQTTFGTPNVVETCNALAVFTSVNSNNPVFIGGWSEKDGLLTSELHLSGQNRPIQTGIVMDIKLDGEVAILQGGALVKTTVGAHSIEKLLTSGDRVWAISWESASGTTNTDFDATQVQPNLSPFRGGTLKRGTNYYVNVLGFKRTPPTVPEGQVEQTLEQDWDRQIGTLFDVWPGGMIFRPNENALLLAGSAIGSNDAIPSTSMTRQDWDGFITKIDAQDGLISGGGTGAYRIQSEVDRDDFIYDICSDGADQVFIVGMTKGTMTGGPDNAAQDEHAFLMMINPDTLNPLGDAMVLQASKVGGGGGDMQALKCSVTADGTHVYVGGVVKDGATIDAPPAQEAAGGGAPDASSGGDDVFVAQFDIQGRKWQYIRQIGTTGNEFLVDLTADKDGNALVFANTNGAYYGQAPAGETNMIVLSVTRDTGEFPKPIGQGGSSSAAPISAQVPATPAPVTILASPAPTPLMGTMTPHPSVAPWTWEPTWIPPDDTPPPVPGDNTPLDAQAGGGSKKTNGGLIAVLVVMFCVLFFAACFVYQRRRRRNYYPDSTQVVEYLKGFDDVEVDLKHSATGGFHGTYINHDGGPRYMDSTTSSLNMPTEINFQHEMEPFVQDSLFVIDDDDTPNLGGGNSNGGGRKGDRPGLGDKQGSNYDGLVDAYNTTWDDLSPHSLTGAQPIARTRSRDSGEHIGLMDDVNISGEGDGPWGREII